MTQQDKSVDSGSMKILFVESFVMITTLNVIR